MSTERILSNIRKLSLKIMLIIGISFFPCHFVLANGNCTGPSGGVNNLIANLGNITVTNPQDNVAGRVIASAYSWTLSGYTENCACTGTNQNSWYWTTTTNLPSAGTDNWLIYSDYLDIRLWIQDSHWSGLGKAVPFTNQITSTAASENKCNVDVNFWPTATGSHGVLDLRIRKPFVGTVTLPSSLVISSLYSCMASDNTCDARGSPTINYRMSGTVTVPQNCTLDAGEIVTIDFGNIWSGKFNT